MTQLRSVSTESPAHIRMHVHVHIYMCTYMNTYICISLSLSVPLGYSFYLSIYRSLCISISLIVYVPISIQLSTYVSVHRCLSGIFLSMHRRISLSICRSISLLSILQVGECKKCRYKSAKLKIEYSRFPYDFFRIVNLISSAADFVRENRDNESPSVTLR